MSAEITDNIFFIAASDYVIQNAPKHGGFDFNKLLSQFDRSKYLENHISAKNEVEFYNWSNFNNVISFMEAEGILQRQPAGTGYELTELGREVKRHGSQKQYYDYIINRDNAIFENVKWAKETSRHTKNTMWIIAFYTLVTLGIFITGMITCNQKNLPQTNQTKHPNSTKEIKASKITDTVK